MDKGSMKMVKNQFTLFYPLSHEDRIHGDNCKFSIDICIYNGDRLTLDCSCVCSSEYEFGALYSEPTLKHFNSWSHAGVLTNPYIRIGNGNINVFIERLNEELAKIIS